MAGHPTKGKDTTAPMIQATANTQGASNGVSTIMAMILTTMRLDQIPVHEPTPDHCGHDVLHLLDRVHLANVLTAREFRHVPL